MAKSHLRIPKSKSINPHDAHIALESYVDGQYWGINTKLERFRNNLTDSDKQTIAELDSLMLPNKQDTLVRIVQDLRQDFGINDISELRNLVGKTITKRSYQSTSSDIDFKSDNELALDKAKIVYTNAHIFKAIDVNSEYPENPYYYQKEIIIQRNTKYKIQKIDYSSDEYPIVYAKFVK